MGSDEKEAEVIGAGYLSHQEEVEGNEGWRQNRRRRGRRDMQLLVESAAPYDSCTSDK